MLIEWQSKTPVFSLDAGMGADESCVYVAGSSTDTGPAIVIESARHPGYHLVSFEKKLAKRQEALLLLASRLSSVILNIRLSSCFGLR